MKTEPYMTSPGPINHT